MKQMSYVQKNDEFYRLKWNKCRTCRKTMKPLDTSEPNVVVQKKKTGQMKLVDSNETNVVRPEKRWNL